MTICPCFGGPQAGVVLGQVKLNVGGIYFTTSKATLSKCDKLVALVEEPPGPDGTYFLDRDGRYFSEILNFCRDGPELFHAPTEEDARRLLRREALFFGLQDLADMVGKSYCGARIPANEESRVKRLEGLNIMHTNEHDHNFDSLTNLVSAVLDVPIALISLVHTNHQWFKSRVGLEASQTSRSSSFCAFTFTPEEPGAAQMLVVEDAKSDSRTSQNPLVLGEPFIGFYAGSPIITSDGVRLGAICAIDHVPRSLTSTQAQVLVNLSQITAQEIEREQLMSMEEDHLQGHLDTVPSSVDFAAGPLRGERMREALDEAVLLVRVRSDSSDWPVLFGNRYFTEISGIRLTPSRVLTGRATASGDGMRNLRGSAGKELGLWDYLQLTGKGEKQLLKEIKSNWARPEASIFALQATAPALSTGSVNYISRGAGADRVRITCRFVPCELPLDVAAEAIRPVPQRDASRIGGDMSHLGTTPNDRLYFVSMRVMGRCAGSVTTSAVNSAATTPVSREAVMAELKTMQKGGGKSIEAIQHVKAPKSPFQDVRLLRMVGKGSFGKVSYGLWMGSPVAVKIIESKAADRMKKFEPVFEAALSASIAHPNLVQTFKYSTRAKPPEDGVEQESTLDPMVETWMVQEWCDRGTLQKLCDEMVFKKDLTEVVEICSDISRAGSYLHSRGIIHGDLTANNVLIKTQVSRKGYICKIADFGLARVLEGSDVEIVTTQLGTVTHMPPELFELAKEVKLTTKADIYAAGILLFQTLACESPFAGLSAPQVVVQVTKGKKPKLPDDTPETLNLTYQKCTASEPRDRPTFDELVQTYGGIVIPSGA